MSTTNTLVTKLFGAVVAVAMVFTFVTPASAQSTADLQQMINDLLAQISSLQSQIGQGGTSVASGVCPYTWTRSLTTGSEGADVMKLQQFLNADADTRVSASGVGSVGAETTYFGGLTAAAVSKFQSKYRSDVLSPAGLVNPTGYFGPASMAKANALCVSAPVVVDDSTDVSTEEADVNESSANPADIVLSGEGSIKTFAFDSADDDELGEGDIDAEIMEVTFEFENGDVMFTRFDFALVGSGDEQDPWDTFETISVWYGGQKILEKNIGEKSDYLNKDNGTVRFSDLNFVLKEDQEVQIVVAVTLKDSIDGTADGEPWTVTISSVRFFDGQDVPTTSSGPFGTPTGFTIKEAGAEDELIVKTSSDDPDSTTLALETNSKSSWLEVFAFDLDTDDSVNDITVETLPVGVTLSSSTFDGVIDDARLTVDGQVFTDFTYTNGMVTELVFDIDDELVIDAGDRVTAVLELKFLQLAAGNEGITVSATSTGTSNVADGADDLTGSQLSGAATGDTHTLRTEGAIIKFVSSSETAKLNTDSITTDDEGTFVIKVDVTAFETDLYFNKTAASGTAMGTVAASFIVEDSGGSQVVTGTSSASLASTAKTEGGKFKVAQGETKEFTLTVNYDPATTGFYQLQLYSLNWATSAVNPTTQQLALPSEDFESGQLSINN